MRLALSYLGNEEFTVLQLSFFFFSNKLFNFLCKTRMNSCKIFGIIHKITNVWNLRGYSAFNIVKIYCYYRENLMLLLHTDIYSQLNIYFIIYHVPNTLIAPWGDGLQNCVCFKFQVLGFFSSWKSALTLSCKCQRIQYNRK